MTYFKRVSDKIALKLNDHTYTDEVRRYVIGCCDFHGCSYSSVHLNHNQFCETRGPALMPLLFGTASKLYDAFRINHYARSIEKYELKSKTWTTSNGENTGYNILGYLDRAVGWNRDSIALRYTCQVRNRLILQTGKQIYLRPGSMWMRNVEFGQNMTYREKGMRHGSLVPAGYKFPNINPYHYHGSYIHNLQEK
jgi:hypothetical protein